MDVARSVHYVAGLNGKVGKLTYDLEGYYKFVHNNPIINDEKFFPHDPDLISGKQESYGYEAYLTFREYPINLTASYSISWAYLEKNEWIYNPRYDIRHSLNLLFDLNLGRGFLFSGVWILNTGMPFTQNMGYLKNLMFDNAFNLSDTYLQFVPSPILFGKNLGRLSDYHRLDLGISKKLSLNGIDVYIEASVINVYNRENIFYIDRETGERINMLPIIPSATLKITI